MDDIDDRQFLNLRSRQPESFFPLAPITMSDMGKRMQTIMQ